MFISPEHLRESFTYQVKLRVTALTNYQIPIDTSMSRLTYSLVLSIHPPTYNIRGIPAVAEEARMWVTFK